MDAADAPKRDLDRLLIGLRPRLLPGRFVFVARDATEGLVFPADEVMASVREPEGLTLVIEKSLADRVGLEYDFVGHWIILGVESALDAVGLTAVVSSRLAEAGISCNVIAGLRHDHLVVPEDSAERAVELLEGLEKCQ